MNPTLQAAITISAFTCTVGGMIGCYLLFKADKFELKDVISVSTIVAFFMALAFFLQRWVH